jgi:hypothetical protein
VVELSCVPELPRALELLGRRVSRARELCPDVQAAELSCADVELTLADFTPIQRCVTLTVSRLVTRYPQQSKGWADALTVRCEPRNNVS